MGHRRAGLTKTMTRRLSPETVERLPPRIRRPAYERAALRVGLAHLGVGAFHRCHQADYTDDLLEARFGPFGVVGINLRPPLLAESLAPQDGLFTRTLRQDGLSETRLIGCHRRSIDAGTQDGVEAALVALADPAIGVATMTLTEKGYCHVPSTG